MSELASVLCRCGGYEGCPVCWSYDALDAAKEDSRTLATGEFIDVLSHAGRAHGPTILLVAYRSHVITNETVTATIGPWAWSVPELPEDSLLVTRADWIELFDVAGFTIDGKPADRPDEPVELWRGSVPARRRRMSWTSDRVVAEKFASGEFGARPEGKLYTTTCPPESLLCINKGRNEAEHVINPKCLVIKEDVT